MQETRDPKPDAGWWPHAGTLTQVAVYLVIAAASWYLLKELAVLLRPLLIAALICYLILPVHSRLQKQHSEPKTIAIMVVGGSVMLAAFGFLIYGSIASLNEELPRLTERAQHLAAKSRSWSNDNLPDWANRGLDDFYRAESKGVLFLQAAGTAALAYSADLLLETLVVALYVVFIMVEAARLRKRVLLNFEADKSSHILETVRRINDGIGSYLKAKVRTSAILAVPVTLLLFAFGVKFAPIWGMLTFLANFIPYVGTVIGLGLPLIFTFLDLPMGWQPLAVMLALIACHAACAAFVEPTLIGKAVGLSPLFVLVALTFWGLCWGVVGMFLAIPLTVTLKIIFVNIEATKPVAAMLGDSE
jgi:AI-2 transport protein TqsA